MEVFKWETASGSKKHVAWLKENYNKPITEEEYVQHKLDISETSLYRSRRVRSAKHNYHHLKNKFGFFTSEARAE